MTIKLEGLLAAADTLRALYSRTKPNLKNVEFGDQVAFGNWWQTEEGKQRPNHKHNSSEL